MGISGCFKGDGKDGWQIHRPFPHSADAVQRPGRKHIMKPLAIDLFCGLGGWTDGLLAEGWDVIGFDNERHQYGDAKYPAQLVLQDVLTLHGKQFKDVDLIVASPPCQEYSYMAMPWSRAKAIEQEYLIGKRDRADLTALFDACFRIQREACEAAGRHIPLIVENVRGAQKWVGRSRFNYGSFHLWGDVPALMPMTKAAKVKGHSMNIGEPKGNMHHKECVASVEETGIKAPGMIWSDQTKRGQDFTRLAGQHAAEGMKNTGGSWFNIPGTGGKAANNNPVHNGIKQSGISGMRDNGKGDRWFQDGAAKSGSKSKARKSASAAIAKIPFPLSLYIATHFYPRIE
jgi:hypothetical protein